MDNSVQRPFAIQLGFLGKAELRGMRHKGPKQEQANLDDEKNHLGEELDAHWYSERDDNDTRHPQEAMDIKISLRDLASSDLK